ncbi:DUF159 family protein [Kordiimonas sediminis]|uniref:Abasic site processing protein n=1 Tax=Kordiimonas sediminis TaxID=1735581 RepID=A0A919ASV1_9PROT|nr:SOS response-associated peptidase [Kordiimonas sediminis]GHF23512.1 DUF159 family protein [Kordiimonas sediminis]
MCGRYTLVDAIEELRKTFGVQAPVAIDPRYNIAPRQPVLIVRHDEYGKRELVAVEWGFVPEWAKEINTKPLINARIETVEVKPSFRSSVKRKRCLVPFSGWYEWRRQNGLALPYYISPTKKSPAAFAGIWSTWHGPEGEHWLETMAIVTAEATGPLRSVHKRKPLVVQPHQYEAWLRPEDPLPRGFLKSFDWMPETQFHWQAVSRRVNSVRFDDPACLLPNDDVSQGSLF